MTVLFDTNILTRTAQPGHPLQSLAIQAGDILKDNGAQFCLVAQVVYEFWAVATRPAGENSLGLTTVEARAEVASLRRLFVVYSDSPAILPLWEELVANHDVKGKNTHDARLVAAMKVHDITHVLTFNDKDFARYSGITVLTPERVIAQNPSSQP